MKFGHFQNLDLESVIQSEVRPEREKQISHINTYMWNLENGADEPTCKAGIEMQT